MSSTCNTTTLCPCNHSDCGCPNPTSFNCVDSPGTLTALGVISSMKGDEVLSVINDAVQNLKDGAGKVLVDADDTCPELLFDKLEEGLNISFSISGVGCDRKLRINSSTGGVAIDVNVKTTANDTTSGYLDNKLETGAYLKRTIINPLGNERLKIDVDPIQLISTDFGNMLTLGSDGRLVTAYTAPDGSETKLIQGAGIILMGTGTTTDPYIISANTSIQATRTCFDGVWRPVTLVASGNTNVVYVSGAPQYRYRFDGSIEFKGSVTYTVSFGTYQTTSRKFTIPMGNIPITCVSAGELSGTADLKSINYIDSPQASADQITQQYGYIIRKSAQNLIVEFQSSFTNATTKTIAVNFEGAVIHPSI